MPESARRDSPPAIEVRDLCKEFDGVHAVQQLNFTVQPGEILGLLGPNGAGKTTTVQLLLGLTTPTCGSIKILGMDLQHHRRAILSRVNFTSAYISMPGNLRVDENLRIFSRLYNVKNRESRIDELLELLEISHLKTRRTGALSSGQLTRLNLCKALLNDPEVLFLDEPTASLDPHIAAKVRYALLSIQEQRGAAMVYTSHNMLEVEAMCDKVIFLSSGRVAASGTPEEIVQAARSESLEDVFITIAEGGDIYSAENHTAG